MNGDDSSSRSMALGSLRDRFSDPSLRSSTRVLILISLALNQKMSFVDLQNSIGIGKGSLSHHLEKMGSAGYVKVMTKATFRGDRTVVEITDKGLEAYDSMLEALSSLKRGR